MTSKRHFTKFIILGAGPGGLQMGYFMAQAARDYLILEKCDVAGAAFALKPRHGKLISINKKFNFFEEEEFNWRHDWNSLLSDEPSMRFPRYSDDLFPDAATLQQYLQDFAAYFGLNIAYQVTVTHIAREPDGLFVISTSTGTEYSCQVLLNGLGTAGPRIPDDIEGIELALGYEDHPLDLEFYRNKRVAIIGQGNSAFETADFLAGAAAYVHIFAKAPLKFAWDSHFVGDLRAVNNNVLDMYQLKSLHAVLNPRLQKISRLPDGTLLTKHEYDFAHSATPGTLSLSREYDYIIRCTGFSWLNATLFSEDIRPASWYQGKFPTLSPIWESSNVPDLFFVGGAMQGNDRKAASGFIHGFRYNIRTLHRILEERYEGVAYPADSLAPFEWQAFVDWMYQRFSVTAALFQLFGVLCDTLVLSPDLRHATRRLELPFDYARSLDYGSQHVLFLTLQFGFEKFSESAISFMGPSDPSDTKCASFLHPVIYHLHEGDWSEFHFGDSLLARWDRPHESGGAVMSYHYAFQQWAQARLGLQLDLPALVEGGAFRKWTTAEIAQWQAEHVAPVVDYPCHKAM